MRLGSLEGVPVEAEPEGVARVLAWTEGASGAVVGREPAATEEDVESAPGVARPVVTGSAV